MNEFVQDLSATAGGSMDKAPGDKKENNPGKEAIAASSGSW